MTRRRTRARHRKAPQEGLQPSFLGVTRISVLKAVLVVIAVLGASLYAYAAGVEAERASTEPPVWCVYPDTGEVAFGLVGGGPHGRIFVLGWNETHGQWESVGIYEC